MSLESYDGMSARQSGSSQPSFTAVTAGFVSLLNRSRGVLSSAVLKLHSRSLLARLRSNAAEITQRATVDDTDDAASRCYPTCVHPYNRPRSMIRSQRYVIAQWRFFCFRG